MATNILVLGGTGMLGSMVADYLSRESDLTISATARTPTVLEQFGKRANSIHWRLFDAEISDERVLSDLLHDQEWAINCIGVIKPYIHDDNSVEVERAIRVNSLFPATLARTATKSGTHVIQIATDCVYSGQKGAYIESDTHDALDVYGKTKSLGEDCSPNVCHLRCSIIGPEPKAHVSLLDWFLGQQSGAKLNGFTNHAWNGITTLHFAKICRGIIAHGLPPDSLQHLIPTGTLTKCELLQCFAKSYQREEVIIKPMEAKVVVDRTLSTSRSAINALLWLGAGYTLPPSIPDMVDELAKYTFRFDARHTALIQSIK